MERTIGYDEARHFLATRSVISSNFGRTLERLENQEGPGGYDPLYQQRREEIRRLNDAAMIRCMDALTNRDAIRFAWCPDLRGFAKRAKLGEGEAAVRILCKYEPWDPKWPEKGLADAYTWMRSLVQQLPEVVPENGSTAQAFRVGTSPRARRIVAAIVADAHVILAEWVRIWNGRRKHAA
jgi:hypothetical protein